MRKAKGVFFKARNTTKHMLEIRILQGGQFWQRDTVLDISEIHSPSEPRRLMPGIRLIGIREDQDEVDTHVESDKHSMAERVEAWCASHQ